MGGSLWWNRCKASCYSLAFCLSICFSGNALAVLAPFMWGDPANSAGVAATGQQVCDARAQYFNPPDPLTFVGGYTTGAGAITFSEGYFSWDGSAMGRCLRANGTIVGYPKWGQFCGAGVAHTGASPNMQCAACPAPYVEVNGACVPAPICPKAGAVTYPTALDGGFFVAAGAGPYETGPNGSSFCLPHNGGLCEVKCATGMVGPNPIASGEVAVCTSLTATGSACSPATMPEMKVELNPLAVEPETGPGTEPNSPSDCPPGTGFAQVNNQKMCLPSGTVGSGASSSSSSSDGGSTKSESTWEIGADGTVTTTNQTTVNLGDGSSLSSSSSSKSGMDGADGKDAPPLDFGPPPSFDDSAVAGLDDAALPVGAPLAPFQADLGLFGGGGACPAPITFEAMGVGFEIPFDGICQFSGMIRALFILSAVFISLRVLVMA